MSSATSSYVFFKDISCYIYIVTLSCNISNSLLVVRKKAMDVLFKRIRNFNIPIDLQLYLFDHVNLPVALYVCRIRGFETSQIIENT